MPQPRARRRDGTARQSGTGSGVDGGAAEALTHARRRVQAVRLARALDEERRLLDAEALDRLLEQARARARGGRDVRPIGTGRGESRRPNRTGRGERCASESYGAGGEMCVRIVRGGEEMCVRRATRRLTARVRARAGRRVAARGAEYQPHPRRSLPPSHLGRVPWCLGDTCPLLKRHVSLPAALPRFASCRLPSPALRPLSVRGRPRRLCAQQAACAAARAR